MVEAVKMTGIIETTLTVEKGFASSAGADERAVDRWKIVTSVFRATYYRLQVRTDITVSFTIVVSVPPYFIDRNTQPYRLAVPSCYHDGSPSVVPMLQFGLMHAIIWFRYGRRGQDR